MARLLVAAAGRVTVENRPAESDVRFGMSIGTEGHVPPRHDELELIAARLAENGDVLLFSPRLAARVVFELLEETGIPFRVNDAAENIVDNGLLLPRVKIAADGRLGDVPIVGHACSQQAARGLDEIPIEAHNLLLLVGQGVVERLDGGFGGTALAGRGGGFGRGEQRQTGRGNGGGRHAHAADKITTIHIRLARFAVRTHFLLFHDVAPFGRN